MRISGMTGIQCIFDRSVFLVSDSVQSVATCN
ncbi:hypothetical protein BDI4_580007 [Burkholderia diffusa]|nr:hypothetical protein BDI4_580007 [Burkholderia diffusa]